MLRIFNLLPFQYLAYIWRHHHRLEQFRQRRAYFARRLRGYYSVDHAFWKRGIMRRGGVLADGADGMQKRLRFLTIFTQTAFYCFCRKFFTAQLIE